jgi:fatty-acyl-CoA synthase
MAENRAAGTARGGRRPIIIGAMDATIMDSPLGLTAILERSNRNFKDVEIVWRRPDRSLVRMRYADFYRRARALASALAKAGLRRGDRVATMMWNHAAHLEAYFGVPCAGGVVHPLNIRLHPDELVYIANHAGDRFLIVDDVLLPVFRAIRDRVAIERVFVVPTGGASTDEHEDYERFLGTAPDDYNFPEIDEREPASMCYTSGTTGRPKGVVYSHRSISLHSLVSALPDSFALSQHDTLMLTSPMFHVNGWGLPYTGVLAGARLVFPGPHVDAASLLELFQSEQVTMTGAVPTVWIALREILEQAPGRVRFAPGCRAVVGGAAPSMQLIADMDRHGVRLLQGWGLTETSPLATLGIINSTIAQKSAEVQLAARARQGPEVPCIELRVVDESGRPLPRDGRSVGEIQIRGPWVASSYYQYPEGSDRWSPDGWFLTGDMGTIDEAGYLGITDRKKDLIKSGGEWISSVDLENTLMTHPAVRESAVVGIPHETWGERPLALVVLRPGAAATPGELRVHLSQHFAKWQIPDTFLFVGEIPKTSVGKFKKTEIRARYGNEYRDRPA